MVLEADIASYLARDRESWEQCWVKDGRFRSFMECGTMQIARSYEDFRQNVFEAMDAEPEPVKADVRLENLEIELNGTVAWATFEEMVESTSNPLAAPNHSHNFRLLEHSDGQWRILIHGCWAEPLRDTDTPAIEVSADGQVLWLNNAAQSRLKSFRGLTISNGKLRASRRSWDAGLQNAISGAHNLTGFGEYNRAKSEGAGEVSFPVVLGENDDGALLLCWAKVADGRVYILFGSDRNLSKQIKIAQAIYGISKTQTEIIEHIAQGLDLTDAAVELGITKNTARTHLRRVYEKVDVSSQIELLRLLISFDT
ncbi:MAG: LuxR C-terminal-related transcriptional regulator [Hyphomicrobiales bacterium]